MAVKTIEEITKALTDKLGEDTSDEAIALLEDVSDTLNDYNQRITDNGDWKKKYETNDADWRKKYRDRFMGKVDDSADDKLVPKTDDEPVPKEKLTFDSLFKEGE